MLKPKSQIFKLKFHLAKVQAVNNKVNSRVHAYLHIDNQQLQFKGSPQLKKNIAIFGSDLQYDNFMINFDQITGLYQQKKVLLVIQFQTQGAYIKIGEVNINVGEILNQKKYRVVNVYPLSKCYDKSAKVKLAVDFIPVSEKRDINTGSGVGNKGGNQVNFKQSTMMNVKKQQLITSNVGNFGNSGGFYKNPTGAIKSRLAQQQNVILQQRIYEYEKRMDNYRIAQNQLSERMQQQLQRKDQKISELSLQLTKQQNTIHLITLENQAFKNDIKALNQQNQLLKLQIKSHIQTIQTLQRQILAKQKELQSKQQSLQNISRTKQNKQKHLNSQIQKYTVKYSQSQQERNKIIFELENKLKIQLQKKDQHYQQLININQSKFMESMKIIKQRNKYLQQEFKNMEQLTSQQDNKIKSLTLQLEKANKLSQQQQQQMVYLNQQLNKLKKNKQTINNQLDSINFSYQQSVNQLNSLKQQIKQLLKKLQLLKTQLSLSNQTIQQQRQRIIIINKDLQIHEERQFYMKEHYQEEIYNRQVNQNHLHSQNQQLTLQLKKVKQQLKLSQQKAEQQLIKNQSHRSTIQNLQKQIINKNNLLMKLGQDKIYLQTQVKNSKILISQLQQQLTKLQQQKAYLSQALMQKKIALQNDKSLQWTYKIQSLQNDIQLMVDKFKNQKQTIKQNYRKQQIKKLDQINRLNTLNKKFKQDIDDVRDKLSKRQNYVIGIQKSLKSQKQKSQDYQRQLASLKQSYRLVINQKQSLQQSNKQQTRLKQTRQKQIQQVEKRSDKYKKQLSQIKNGFNRLISIVLEYMVKRYNQRINYQDISLDILIDGEIVSYVNVALKKFCDDHNKTREMIKQLQEFKRTNILNGQNTNKRKNNINGQTQSQQNFNYQNQDYQSKYRKNNYNNYNQYEQQQNTYNSLNNNIKRSYNRTTAYNISSNKPSIKHLQSPFQSDPIKQLQSYRYQIDKYKKQQSQFKVKIKSLQQQIQKHQRTIQNHKYQINKVKSQLQQSQDQITRINFVLRKKDKIIKQLQSQLQQTQKQNFQLKANPQFVIQKAKQKLSNSTPTPIQNPSLPLIRDLQSKLNLKTQQLLHVQKQVQNLRQQYIQQLNQIKKLQSKLKQKTTKIMSLQKQIQSQNNKRVDDKDKQILRLKKIIQNQQLQKQRIQQKLNKLDLTLKQYQLQIQALENNNKELYNQIKSTQIQYKRNIQQNEYIINDKSTIYQTQILQLKSQLTQANNKLSQINHKYNQLNLNLTKKNQQLQSYKQKFSIKQKDYLKSQQLTQQEKNKMILKINSLNDRIRQLQNIVQGKQFQLEQCKFAYQGRVLQLQRQMDQFRDGLIKVPTR